ncbi:hypothetical protein RM697_08990 [Ichthyenterobacterium sp. W332]|uniref:Uncharacterized protein n=1 Tax=Microcosmobacter mediterraneus TaxID=3075607 RepID=A0ABU2YLR5_9FLAO|nr:hypothetical protein [Ichthyenterobacterium sp. W332]MDT0558782.1 hypothetical protein [Ichthyenterobacterium sp. W332]
MEEKTKNTNSPSIQEILSIGYIYILILGIIHNAIYFNLIDVNYLEYASVLDVLISPVSVITSNMKSLLAFIFIIVLAILYTKVIVPLVVKWRRKNPKYQEGKKLKSINTLESMAKSNYALFTMMALFIFGYFIGFGIGHGGKIKDSIANDTIEHNIKVEYINGETKDVKLIGKNSLNIFYIQKGDKTVSISPIEGNVMKIQKLAE